MDHARGSLLPSKEWYSLDLRSGPGCVYSAMIYRVLGSIDMVLDRRYRPSKHRPGALFPFLHQHCHPIGIAGLRYIFLARVHPK
jgi:hypothetical protein